MKAKEHHTMSKHDDYLDPDIHLYPAEPPEWVDTAIENRDLIFKDFAANSWISLYRGIYKSSACGMSVGVQPSDSHEPVYCEKLGDLHPATVVIAILLYSIVEGVDMTTETQVVDMTKPGVLERMNTAIESVEREASDIWNMTHGCPGCAKHFKVRYSPGETPVYPECEKCEGSGECI